MKPLLLLAALLLSACASTGGQPSLTFQIDRLVREQGTNVTVAIAYQELGTGLTLSRYDREVMHPASTMKVPVMLALFEAVDRGEMRLDQPVQVRNEFQSLMDGSPYSLDPAEDSDPDLYKHVGKSLPLEELIRRMIVRSSNLATNLLIERIGATRVTDLMRLIGAEDLRVLRGVEDDKAYQAGMNNVTTARDLLIVLRMLLPGATGSPLSEASRRRMLEILKAQELNEKIPAGLPPGVPVAHKTGDITGIHHDAAIVFPSEGKPYILVILTRGIVDDRKADRLIADISRLIWDYRGSSPAISPSGPNGG
ncbi:MAG TPA: serine hydrolase [Thermoanaerobaculia bacterium]|nr:serine hydrolase [Thermoanaerobaculia bacterium]